MGRIFVYAESAFDYEETIEALKRVFGIFSICPAVVLEDEGFEKLSEEVAAYVKKLYGDFRRLPEYESGCTQTGRVCQCGNPKQNLSLF